mmetsp:Transcript_32973/g.115759  ORF Transcript_32973/g.115759 Transcript_32973/m.115759 type:complete len:134 (-) Transcript_32973:104-505(-)
MMWRSNDSTSAASFSSVSAKSAAPRSQKNLSDVLTVFAGVYLETFKSKADPQYLESLQRFRVILGSMAKFYNDYIYEYAVKLDTAKETMVAFHKANPEYDAEDDADDDDAADAPVRDMVDDDAADDESDEMVC